MKKLINKFASLKGASLISINRYESKTTGEIANHVINVNISVLNAKTTDFDKLKACSDADLLKISATSKIALDVCRIALSELLISAEKNLSSNPTERTAQSQAQTDAYIFLTPAIRLHKETLNLHIFGMAMSKKVLVEVKVPKKTVNSSDKTIAKKLIKKELGLRADKFRDFILGSADNVKIQGSTIEL